MKCSPLFTRVTKDTTNWKNKKESLDTEQSGLKALHASLKELLDQDLDARVGAGCW